MAVKNWLFISVAANFIFLIVIYFAFFSTFSVPAKWKDTGLRGKSFTHLHTQLGKPSASTVFGKGFEQWAMEDAPYWILQVGYDKDGNAASAYVFRVYFKSVYPKTGSIVRLW